MELAPHELKTDALKELPHLIRRSRQAPSIFRKKKVKGPNPLAVRKPKSKAKAVPQSGRAAPPAADQKEGGNRKRARRKSKQTGGDIGE